MVLKIHGYVEKSVELLSLAYSCIPLFSDNGIFGINER